MRKSIVVLIAAVLLIAAGVAAWMWSSPLLDEEAEYEVTSLYRYGEEPLHVVLSEADGVYVMYRDPDWVYSIRDGEQLAADMEALLPQ